MKKVKRIKFEIDRLLLTELFRFPKALTEDGIELREKTIVLYFKGEDLPEQFEVDLPTAAHQVKPVYDTVISPIFKGFQLVDPNQKEKDN